METSDPKYKHNSAGSGIGQPQAGPSDAREGKPQGRGFHKPSEKHTLEEVLKSLQDLIRNDLADGAAAGKPESAASGSQPPETAPATGQKLRREPALNLREDFAPAAPGAGINLDAVLRSLKDLVGNELNVGDEPASSGAKTASTHDEYLAADEQIEEYIPEELGRFDEELVLGDEPVAEAPAPPAPPDEPDVAPELVAETRPQEFAPLDEELTFDTPVDTAPAATPVSATTELPGEISSEMLAQAEPAPAPSSEPAPVADTRLAPGTQQELFLEEPPPIELRLPPSPPAPEIAPAPEAAPEPDVSATPAGAAPEPGTTPEPTVAPTTEPPPSEDGAKEMMQALPTIEVEESFEAGNYFDGAALSAEDSALTLEEIVIEETSIPGTPETAPPATGTPAETPTDAAPAPQPPAPAEKKITLELAGEPAGESRRKTSVDFDAINLAPPPEPDPPAPAAPSLTITPGAAPAEPAPPPAAPPTAETRADAPTPAEPPPAPTEPARSGAPESFNPEDIPVLNEVVAPPAGSVPATPATPPPRPAPDRARDLVVRAVAKLNIEMRKAGGTGLDTRTILRLQQLIRQELEKSGDTNPPDRK